MSKGKHFAIYFFLTILALLLLFTIGHYEKKALTFPKVMFLKGNENLRALPSGSADSIKEIKDSYVIVHNVVHNETREEWAVVEFTDGVNPKYYGCIRLNRLSDRPYEPSDVCNTEAISKVSIGDGLEKALVKFGNQYEVIKSESGLNYSFNKNNGCVVALIDPKSYTIQAINVKVKGYKTNEGFQVGDKAIKALNSYQAKYPKTTERPLSDGRSIFELGDGYVIEFSYEPKELVEESVITGINFYYGGEKL